MSDIIQFMDAESLTQTAGALTQAVSGMSAAEASAAMGATASTGAKIINFTSKTAAGANNIINFPNAATAAEAAEAYVTAGGTVSEVGAATSAAGAAETVGNFTVTKGAAGAIGIGGVLSMSLPAAAAAIAPLAGVALGVGLYKLNPEFWTKISKALLPFCYDDTELLPVTVDSSGQVYFPQGAVNAIKKLFSEIPESTTVSDNINIRDSKALNYSSDNYPITIPYAYGTDFYYSDNENYELSGPSTKSNTYKVIIRFNNIQYAILVFSTDPFQLTNGYNVNTLRTTKNGTPYYAYNGGWRYNDILTKPVNLLFDVPLTWTYDNQWDIFSDIIELVLGGTKTESGGEEGVSKWQGQQVPDGTTGINVLTGFDENGNPNYTPYYPVQIPIGDPGVSANPEEQPNPVAPSTNPAIEPWISPNPWSVPKTYPAELPVTDPTPAPLPNPVPSPQPVPDPSTDPSQDPSQDPDDGGVPDDPTPPKDPTDTGDTPTPTIPIIPILPSAATGLLHVYNPTQTQIDQFGSWLWTTFSGDLIDTLSKLFNDPMDAVIGLHELYTTPATSGDTTIKAGYLDSGVSSKLVGSRYTTINCGSVVVEEYYHNYLDYSPYTQCYIYLPFIGIVTVSADDIVGNAVNIVYHIDSYTGCCIAVITVAKKGYSSTVYQFEGNCAVEIPITSGYQSTMMAGLMGVAGTAISGNPTVGLHAAHIGRAGLGKNSVQHSGSFGASYGAMGVKIPYIIVKRPTQKIITNYSVSYGYPAHKMVYVGNCTGYLRAKEVRVTSTTATNIEKEMIVSALKAGVYVK